MGDALASEALDQLAEPDDEYLVTYPGTSAVLEFQVPAPSTGMSSSYILSSQGYYSEWIRPQWIREATAKERFRPAEDTIEKLMTLWLSKKDEFETAFFDSRLPVQ